MHHRECLGIYQLPNTMEKETPLLLYKIFVNASKAGGMIGDNHDLMLLHIRISLVDTTNRWSIKLAPRRKNTWEHFMDSFMVRFSTRRIEVDSRIVLGENRMNKK